jgi:hypothetical protein
MSRRLNKAGSPGVPPREDAHKPEALHSKQDQRGGAEASEPRASHAVLDGLFKVCVVVPVLPIALTLLFLSSAMHGTFVYDDRKL